jgi:hypothetical protein
MGVSQSRGTLRRAAGNPTQTQIAVPIPSGGLLEIVIARLQKERSRQECGQAAQELDRPKLTATRHHSRPV